METNLVLKAEDLTPDFADGIRKLFSNNATLYIRVEYGGTPSGAGSTGEASTGKRRGRPSRAAVASEGLESGPKKRGRKPGKKAKASPSAEGAKKRGRKPKAETAE